MADSKGSSAPKKDSKGSTRCEAVKGDGAIIINPERAICHNGSIMAGKNKVELVLASSNIKQIGGSEGVKRSLISKSFYQRTPTPEAFLQANQASNLLVPVMMGDGIECASRKNLVQLFSNQSSIFPSNNYNQKKLDGDTSRRKGLNDEATERVEEFTFNTGKEVLESDKNKPEDKINRTGNRTENLRMKLCQILGAASSPKTQHSGSHNRSVGKVGKESLPLEQRLNQKENRIVMTRDNSDTIETDSENPGHTHKRPVTRSRSRKKVSSRKLPGKGKSCPSSKDKEDNREKDVFSIREKLTGRHDAFPNDGSSMSSKKKGQGKSSRIMPHKICFSENDTAEKLYKDTPKTDQPLHVGETFSPEGKIGGFNDCLPDHETIWPHTENINPAKEFHQPATVNNSGQNEELEVSENGNEQEYRSNTIEPNVTKSQDNFQSPTFQFKTPSLSSSPSSTPKADQKSNDVSIPASTERRFSLGASRYVMTFKTSEPDFFGLRDQRQSSDLEEPNSFASGKKASFVDEKEEQDDLSDSSFEDMNFSGCQEGLPFIKEGSRERQPTERSTFMLPPIKRLCKHQGIKFNHNSPASLSSKGIRDADWIDEASEQNQDEFVRAVELFAMELSKLKGKLKSMTNHKSSEILKSVSEEINLQLQNAHSKIQSDIGRLTNLSKSKRKRLETKFEDQQKQLRLICDRFKQEVNLHLQDCRSTIEGLEADRIEIKGALEKQRGAHTKLLTQVEEAVETQLNDAQRKITATHEMARGKLLQLKRVIAMCLKEGILN